MEAGAAPSSFVLPAAVSAGAGAGSSAATGADDEWDVSVREVCLRQGAMQLAMRAFRAAQSEVEERLSGA